MLDTAPENPWHHLATQVRDTDVWPPTFPGPPPPWTNTSHPPPPHLAPLLTLLRNRGDLRRAASHSSQHTAIPPSTPPPSPPSYCCSLLSKAGSRQGPCSPHTSIPAAGPPGNAGSWALAVCCPGAPGPSSQPHHCPPSGQALATPGLSPGEGQGHTEVGPAIRHTSPPGSATPHHGHSGHPWGPPLPWWEATTASARVGPASWPVLHREARDPKTQGGGAGAGWSLPPPGVGTDAGVHPEFPLPTAEVPAPLGGEQGLLPETGTRCACSEVMQPPWTHRLALSEGVPRGRCRGPCCAHTEGRLDRAQPWRGAR